MTSAPATSDSLGPSTPLGPSAVRIVLPDGTDAASRDRVLGAVVTYLTSKDFAVEVNPSAPDVFILSAESAPRILALPHRIEGVDVNFVLSTLAAPALEPATKRSSPQRMLDDKERQRSVICVSDIHGRCDELIALWDALRKNLGTEKLAETPVVFLGECVLAISSRIPCREA